MSGPAALAARPRPAEGGAPKPPVVPAIQTMRALAVLLVAAVHVRGAFLAAGLDRAIDLDAFQVGVDVFFVVSGFVMLHVERGQGAGAAGGFLLRRAIRVAPLYWIFTTLAAATALHRARHGPDLIDVLQHCLRSYLFWPPPSTDPTLSGSLPIYAVGWTLNCEAFFYAAFAVLMLASPRRRFGAGVLLLGGLVVLGQSVVLPSPWWFWTRPYLLEFAAGMAIAALFRRGWRLGRGASLALALAAVALFAAGVAWPDTLSDLVGDIIDDARPIGFGLPAALLVAAAGLSRWVPRGVPGRALLFLGDASYAIYLTHPTFYDLAMPALRRLTGVHPNGLKLAAAWVVLFAMGVLAGCAVHLFVERPLLRRMRRLTRPSRRAVVPDRWSDSRA